MKIAVVYRPTGRREELGGISMTCHHAEVSYQLPVGASDTRGLPDDPRKPQNPLLHR